VYDVDIFQDKKKKWLAFIKPPAADRLQKILNVNSIFFDIAKRKIIENGKKDQKSLPPKMACRMQTCAPTGGHRGLWSLNNMRPFNTTKIKKVWCTVQTNFA
jgi:hypothetical protein